MKLWYIGVTHAEKNTLNQAIDILERIARHADSNADNADKVESDDDTDHAEIVEMSREIANTADTASAAIDDLLYVIQRYDFAGYNDDAE